MAVEKEGGVPLDIIQTILLLLPLKSLLRFKTACKSWNAIISEYDFARQHMQRIKSSTGTQHTLIWGEDDEFYVTEFEDSNFKDERKCEKPYDYKGFLCSGDGLALLKTSTTSCSNSSYLLLWNPCTSQSTKIPCNYEFTTFGICRGPSMDDYKVVAICSSSYYAVYSFKAGLWSKKKRYPFQNTIGRRGGLFVDGFSFWLTVDGWQFLYFDPRDENFKELQWPTGALIKTQHISTLSMTNLGGSLCIYDEDYNLEKPRLWIWILKDNNVDSNSWSEIIIKDGLPLGLITPLFLTDKNELLMQVSYCIGVERFGAYNFVEKTFRKLDVPQSSACNLVLIEAPYLNTLFFPTKRILGREK